MRRVLWFILKHLAVVLIFFAGVYWYMLAMPGVSHQGALPQLSAQEGSLAANLRLHVTEIAGNPRNTAHPEALEEAAKLIEARLRAIGYVPQEQRFRVEGEEVRNIEAVLGPIAGMDPDRVRSLVVGAHYDSAGPSPGANDNGSGVAALLEIARLLKDHRPKHTRLRYAFFVNEEPPYFQTENMGSLVYARALIASGEKLKGMISLETLGYFSDKRGSQKYPPFLSLALPDTGNFMAVVGTLSNRSFVAEIMWRFRDTAAFPSVGGVAPVILPGIDWSDHWSFGQVGVPSAMITDTALFRYPYYHTLDDTPEKLDYDRMARITAGMARVIRGMSP